MMPICTSESLRTSTRVSSGFVLLRHSSPSFGSQRVRSCSAPPTNATWKNASFSQHPRNINGTNIMVYTIRTDRYRYTEWAKFIGAPTYKPEWNVSFGVELYDHQKDPDENFNRAFDPSYVQTAKQLSYLLHAGWRLALPSSEKDNNRKKS
ncbi:IDS [Mytilus edulis]|uniref:IDS n=1 Tax=Mytilus edulis TaxID=6550 RepID=A0A8S3TME4_MYTED|nr:IDS [Mytilus edulis]